MSHETCCFHILSSRNNSRAARFFEAQRIEDGASPQNSLTPALNVHFPHFILNRDHISPDSPQLIRWRKKIKRPQQ